MYPLKSSISGWQMTVWQENHLPWEILHHYFTLRKTIMIPLVHSLSVWYFLNFIPKHPTLSKLWTIVNAIIHSQIPSPPLHLLFSTYPLRLFSNSTSTMKPSWLLPTKRDLFHPNHTDYFILYFSGAFSILVLHRVCFSSLKNTMKAENLFVYLTTPSTAPWTKWWKKRSAAEYANISRGQATKNRVCCHPVNED